VERLKTQHIVILPAIVQGVAAFVAIACDELQQMKTEDNSDSAPVAAASCGR